MKVTEKMKQEFREARTNYDTPAMLQHLKGQLLIQDLIDKYGKDGVEKIAKALDEEDLKNE